MQLQVDHPLENYAECQTLKTYILSLLHKKAYEKAAELSPGKSVLDWGCNDGYGLAVLMRSARMVAGLDTGPHCIDATRRRFPKLADRIRLYENDTFPFGDEKFDLITCFQVIEHVEELESLILPIRRALNPGGVVLFTTPNRLIRLEPWMKPWNPFHVREFSGSELQEILMAYFPKVSIMSLHGEERLLSVERNRCLKILSNERQRQLKGDVPEAVQPRRTFRSNPLYRKVRLGIGQIAKTPGVLALTRYSWRLRYRADRLVYRPGVPDDAVDFMAICEV